VIVGQCSELAYNVVLCRIVTGWNRENYGLERVHLDVLAMDRGEYEFPWKYVEILNRPVHLCSGRIRRGRRAFFLFPVFSPVMGMLFPPSFLAIDLDLSVIGISGSFFSLPFSFSGSLAVSTVAVFLFGVPWVYRLNSMTSIAAEGFHGIGFLKRDCAMGSKKRAK
jgi:hypothetical protein